LFAGLAITYLDGYELCRRMRALNLRTPILFFSGAAYEADKKRGIEAGADAYLVKPDIAGLVGSIARLVAPPNAPTANIIPFISRTGFSPPLNFKPAAA
jgi:two-component system response regulator MprA